MQSALFHESFPMNKVFARAAVFVAPLALAANSAMAAVPADVTSALADMKADGLVIAGVVLVATIAIFAFKFLRKGI